MLVMILFLLFFVVVGVSTTTAAVVVARQRCRQCTSTRRHEQCTKLGGESFVRTTFLYGVGGGTGAEGVGDGGGYGL